MWGSKTCHPSMSLWHADFLQLKTINVQKTQEEALTFPLNCLMNLVRGPIPEKSYHQRYLKRIWAS